LVKETSRKVTTCKETTRKVTIGEETSRKGTLGKRSIMFLQEPESASSSDSFSYLGQISLTIIICNNNNNNSNNTTTNLH